LGLALFVSASDAIAMPNDANIPEDVIAEMTGSKAAHQFGVEPLRS
jgi:hypothetical protein